MTFIPLKRPFRGPVTHHCKRCVMGETGKKIGKNAENVTWSVCNRVRVALNAVENTTKSLIFSIFADPSPHFHADNVRRHPPPPYARKLITSLYRGAICRDKDTKKSDRPKATAWSNRRTLGRTAIWIALRVLGVSIGIYPNRLEWLGRATRSAHTALRRLVRS